MTGSEYENTKYAFKHISKNMSMWMNSTLNSLKSVMHATERIYNGEFVHTRGLSPPSTIGNE